MLLFFASIKYVFRKTISMFFIPLQKYRMEERKWILRYRKYIFVRMHQLSVFMVDGLISKWHTFGKVKIVLAMYSRWIVMYPMWVIMCYNHLSRKILVEKYNYLCIDFSHSDSKIIQLITTVLKIVLFSEAFCSLWPFQTGGYICWCYTSEATAINKGQYPNKDWRTWCTFYIVADLHEHSVC